MLQARTRMWLYLAAKRPNHFRSAALQFHTITSRSHQMAQFQRSIRSSRADPNLLRSFDWNTLEQEFGRRLNRSQKTKIEMALNRWSHHIRTLIEAPRAKQSRRTLNKLSRTWDAAASALRSVCEPQTVGHDAVDLELVLLEELRLEKWKKKVQLDDFIHYALTIRRIAEKALKKYPQGTNSRKGRGAPDKGAQTFITDIHDILTEVRDSDTIRAAKKLSILDLLFIRLPERERRLVSTEKDKFPKDQHKRWVRNSGGRRVHK